MTILGELSNVPQDVGIPPVGQHYDIGLKMTHSRLTIYPPILILEYLLNTKPKKLCRYLN